MQMPCGNRSPREHDGGHAPALARILACVRRCLPQLAFAGLVLAGGWGAFWALTRQPGFRYLPAVGAQVLSSDPSWEASLLGATWLPARPAAAPLRAGPGSPVASDQRTGAALRSRWGTLVVLGGLSSAAVAGCWFARRRGASS